MSFIYFFLTATKQLYDHVRQSVHMSVTPFHSIPVIVSSSNFQTLLPLAKVISTRKVRGQRTRSQRSKQILPQFGSFRTVTLVRIHRWLRNDAQSFKWHKRGVLLFSYVIRQISRSRGLKINDFDWN